MDELLPCPFCGSENTDVGFVPHTDDCYLMLRYMNDPRRKGDLAMAWNTRPLESALRARNAELEKIIVELECQLAGTDDVDGLAGWHDEAGG